MVSNLGNTEGALDSYRKAMVIIERLNREAQAKPNSFAINRAFTRR